MRGSAPPAYPPGAAVPDAWDEAVGADGRARPCHAPALEALQRHGLAAAGAGVADRIRWLGPTFGDDEGTPFHVDPVPRIIRSGEWRALAAGLRQRTRALDAFVADVHGPRRAIAEGIVPPDVLEGCSFLEPDLVGLDRPPGVRIGVAGLDVVRDATGTFRVLEDNCRTPSGLGYLLAARSAVASTLGVPGDVEEVRAEVGPALLAALRATVPDGAGGGLAVVLTDGPSNTAFWEHRCLATRMGVPLLRREDLRLRGDRLVLRETAEPVVAVYRRTDEERLRRPDGRPGTLGELLLPPLRAGRLGVMNGFGCGVADDKRVYGHVPDLVRFFCGEEPLLPDLPVRDLGDPSHREEVLDRASEFVLKPRDGFGGRGVTIGPRASRAELRDATDAVRHRPEAWIAQEAVVLSTHPTLVAGGLRPRHVDLRPFVLADGAGGQRVLPGGLTRVAMDEGEMIVNSSRGGGGKDTWVTA